MTNQTQPKKAHAIGINHVALEVGDIDEALEFYGRFLEFDIQRRSDTDAFIYFGDQFIDKCLGHWLFLRVKSKFNADSDQEVVPIWLESSQISCNVRQERDGLLIGIYETAPEFWALDGIPPDFKEELLPPNIERLEPHLERLIERLPIFGRAGIKVVNNGPMCLTSDGMPLLGPVPSMPGLWLATGFNVGIGTG